MSRSSEVKNDEAKDATSSDHIKSQTNSERVEEGRRGSKRAAEDDVLTTESLLAEVEALIIAEEKSDAPIGRALIVRVCEYFFDGA